MDQRQQDRSADQSASGEETRLVSLAQQGDREAFGELVRLHYPGVVGVVYRMTGDTSLAQDAAQQAFLQAWLNLPAYQPHRPLRSWLYRIAVNSALDVLRRAHRETPHALEDLPLADPLPGPERQTEDRERAALVQQAVLSLPPASRAVLVLREYEGLSYREIAQTLGIQLGTVMSRLNYARRILREKLEPYIQESEPGDE